MDKNTKNLLIAVVIIGIGYYLYTQSLKNTPDSSANNDDDGSTDYSSSNNGTTNGGDTSGSSSNNGDGGDLPSNDDDIYVALKSCSGSGRYVAAEDNSTVNGNRAKRGTLEGFTLADLKGNGGLYSGDIITIKNRVNGHLTEENNTAFVRKNVSTIENKHKFEIKKVGSDGIISSNDIVTLKSLSNNKYVVAENCTQRININRDKVGTWEKFKIIFDPNDDFRNPQ